MFKLKDIPTKETLRPLEARYKELDPLSLQVCYSLIRSGSDLLQSLDRFLEAYKLSQGQFITLSILCQSEETCLTPTEIAAKLGVARATMTIMLDGLEKAGFIKRSIHEVDRRKMCVNLTPKGLSIMDDILPRHFRSVAELMCCLSTEEQKGLLTLLSRLSDQLLQSEEAEAHA